MNRGMEPVMQGGLGRGWLPALLVVLALLLGAAPHTRAAMPAAAVGGMSEGFTSVDAAPGASPAAFGLPWTLPRNAYRIKVQTDGIQALTRADLAAANLPIDTLDPRSLRMYAMGQEIPIRVLGEDDGHFDETDVLLFYGRSADSLFLDGILPTNKYTGTNIYWLTFTCAAGSCAGPYGLRMSEVDGSAMGSTPGPYTRREYMGRAFWYFSASPFEHDADHWYADWVTPATSRTYSFYAYNLPAAAPDATLKVNLLGWGSYSHHLRLWVNNTLVLDGSPGWSGFTTYDTTVNVPHNLLIEGQNRVRVGLLLPVGAPTDQVYLNWVDMVYYDTYAAESGELSFRNDLSGTWRYDISNFVSRSIEVYTVTDSFAPSRVSNTTVSGLGPYTLSFGDTTAGTERYLAVEPAAWKKPTGIEQVTWLTSPYQPIDLLSASNSADYIIITHRDFWAQAQTLAGHRDRDFRVALIDAQQIYDQFNGGLMSAEAIRDFLAYAYANWTPPAPLYVLLMGDGTNDMRKNRSSASTYIPPYLYLADPDLGETAADNRFVTFIGNDNTPDMHIGRFPVNTPAQAQAMVDKVMSYEDVCQCNGSWEKNTLFVADDLEGGGGNFYEYSNLVADGYADPPLNTIKFIPSGYTVSKSYLGMTCDVAGNPTDAAQCRNEITSTMNVTGTLFVSYVGHSTKEVWGSEHLLDKSAVGTLTNGPCLPVMLPMTCYEGSFHDYETPEVLAEASVRKAVSGSIASWSPTGFGLVTGHDYLEKGIFLAWFNEGITRLGPATTYAKQYLVDKAPTGRYLDLLDTFVLLGDPALTLKIGDACLSPTGVRVTTFTARLERGAVHLTWQTADESDVVGFNILRRQDKNGPFAPINDEIVLARHPGQNQGSGYAYVDAVPRLGLIYQYKLEIVKRDGTREEFGSAESEVNDLRLFLPAMLKP